MVIVMGKGATARDVATVVGVVRAGRATARVSLGTDRVVVGAAGELDPRRLRILRGLPGVRDVVRVAAGQELVSREHHPQRSVVDVVGVRIGPGTMTLIAGPCAVETPEQTLAAARTARRAGAVLLHGGVFAPSASGAFPGSGRRGLEILADVGRESGLPVVAEVVRAADVDLVAACADMVQIGARNMRDAALLEAAGSAGVPVLLERAPTATVVQWLEAAECLARRGTLDVVLCERGTPTDGTAGGTTLDVATVPLVQQLSHLPVIVGPSHSGGCRGLVLPLAKAGIVAGADGLLVDVHPGPATALRDGAASLVDEDMPLLADALAELSRYTGRRVRRPGPPILP